MLGQILWKITNSSPLLVSQLLYNAKCPIVHMCVYYECLIENFSPAIQDRRMNFCVKIYMNFEHLIYNWCCSFVQQWCLRFAIFRDLVILVFSYIKTNLVDLRQNIVLLTKLSEYLPGNYPPENLPDFTQELFDFILGECGIVSCTFIR